MKLRSYMHVHEKGPSAWTGHESGLHSYQAPGVGGHGARTPDGNETSIGQVS
jgi:hypothetical protein